MADMLVKLYELPPLEPALTEQRAKGVLIRRGIAPENTTWPRGWRGTSAHSGQAKWR